MTIQEIRDLIAKKIAGQGTQVDVGGGLAAILNAICDKLATIPSPYTLPAATTEALGGVKIGNGLQVAADGTASLKVPVITETLGAEPVEITRVRYDEIIISPLIFDQGYMRILCGPSLGITDVVDSLPNLGGSIYIYGIFQLANDGSIDSGSYLCAYRQANGKYYIIRINI